MNLADYLSLLSMESTIFDATAEGDTLYAPAASASCMLPTLSIRTSESAAVNATSLPALLNVARSLVSALGPAVLLGLACGAVGVAEGTPKSDFNPSRLLRMSIRIAPCLVYRLAF
jgi:hypothetical protein